MRGSTLVAVFATGFVAVGTAVAGAGAPATAHSPGARVVDLVTGDSVSLRQVDGRTSVSVRTLAATGPAAAWTSARVGGDAYVLPAAAHPYLGTVLDPGLFDVTSATPGAASVPADITYSGARPAVPGFTATSTTATSLHGYFNTAGTRAFGTALLAQWRRDAAAGRFSHTLFGASRIARVAAPLVHPDFPQVTLIVKAKDASGAPLQFGFAGLVNTDDGRKYTGFLNFANGEARASVPTGNYSLIGEADSFDPTTFALSTSIVTIPDFSVTTNMQHVTVDFATATVTPSVRTPQPATLSALSLNWLRTVPHGGLGFGFTFGPGDSVKVAPAPAPVHGQVDWETQWSLSGTPASGTPYRYDLAYLDEGAIPADQSHVVTTAQLARIDARYYSVNSADSAAFGRSVFYPFDDFIFTELFSMPVPLHRTEYLTAPSSARWEDSYIASETEQDPFSGFVSDEPRSYAAGTSTSIDWLRGPLAPGMPEPTKDSTLFFCPGCRTRTDMEIFFAPFVDTTPGHQGSLDALDESTTVATFSLYRNGKLLVTEPNSAGDSVQVPAGNATYKAVEETFPALDGFQRSTHTVTELTFQSAAGGTPAPAGWICDAPSCTVLPLLTATVPLPTDLTGTLPLGSSTFTFTIDPVAGAPARTVNSAAMSISLDGGTTYRTVPVTALGHNMFRATITHPGSDAGASVTLRVSGSDTSGDAITETVDDAYLVASS